MIYVQIKKQRSRKQKIEIFYNVVESISIANEDCAAFVVRDGKTIGKKKTARYCKAAVQH